MVLQVFKLSGPAMSRFLSQQPAVLCQDADAVSAKVEAVAAALSCPPAAARKILLSMPLLLNLSSKTLATKIQYLHDTLGVRLEAVADMLLVKQAVLLFSSDKIQSSWSKITRAAGEFNGENGFFFMVLHPVSGRLG